MMTRITAPFVLMLMLAACGDGQPFFKEGTTNTGTTTTTTGTTTTGTDAAGGNSPDGNSGTTDALNTGTTRPPQTADLVARGDIVRAEARTGDSTTGGFVSSVIYNSANDTLIVDGLGFDGANTYSRGNPISQLAAHQVYEADIVALDSLTGATIGQIVPYRAVYGVSRNSLATQEPRTSFAIVRTGGYVGYGYGGYIYERNGATVIPQSGQAQFTGTYAGIRTFNNLGGLELTRGDVQVAIDLRDFNTNDAVKGSISNRAAFAPDGTPIGLGGTGELVLPTLTFKIEGLGGDLSSTGEFSGELSNTIVGAGGALEEYEKGNYYAILAGDATNVADGGEVAGVFVVESKDPRYDGVTAQETGGFIAYR